VKPADAGDATSTPTAVVQQRRVQSVLEQLGIVPADPSHQSAAERAAAAKVSAAVGPLYTAVSDTLSHPPAPVVATIHTLHESDRKHRHGDEPSTVRGPPAPLNGPSSPLTSGSAAAAPSGGAGGITFFAILVGSVSAQLAQAESVAPPCSFESNPAPPTSTDTARAPPAV
jgi:hypothetical protein